MSKKTKQAVKTTIVGGQPPGNSRDMPPIPVALEELLGMAAAQEAFAEVLLEDPDAAVDASDLELTATERAILKAIGRAALEQMIAQVRDTLPEPERRAFLEQAAAALVIGVGVAGAAGGGCKDKPTSSGRTTPQTGPSSMSSIGETGARPDRPVKPDAGAKTMRPTHIDHAPTKGVRPDRPRPRLRYDPNDRKGTGARPDFPRPTEKKPSGGGSKPPR